MFSKCSSDWEKITTFSTPKVLRLAEILEQFPSPDIQKNDETKSIESEKPIKEDNSDSSDNESKVLNDSTKTETDKDGREKVIEPVNKSEDGREKVTEAVNKSEDSREKVTEPVKSKISDLLNEIDKCDFVTLGDKIQDKVNMLEANLKDYQDCECKSEKQSDNVSSKRNLVDSVKIGFGKRSGHRTKGRGRVPRSNAAKLLQMQQNPDALCGIVFMKESLMAKIMFLMIVVSLYCLFQ